MKYMVRFLLCGTLGLAISVTAGNDLTLGNLFLISAEGSGLESVETEVPAMGGAQAQAQAWVQAILEPEEPLESPFPEGTYLRHLYLLKDGTAVVDLSKEALGVPSGATSELLVAYSLVATLCENMKEVRRVFIMIEGRRMVTLAGHLGLEKPLEPNIQLVRVIESPEMEAIDG